MNAIIIFTELNIADEMLQAIKSSIGTIRGKRNAVRTKLEVFTYQGTVVKDDVLSRIFKVSV